MPPKNYRGIDQAYDGQPPHQIGPDTLRLAMLLTRFFYTEDVFQNLTDCAWDNFYTIADRMPCVVIDIEEYVDEVLSWAFAQCGRRGYDRVKEVCECFLLDDTVDQRNS